jgi:hypothetical protein
MPAFEYGLDYLQAGISELEPYLLSKSLFWPLNSIGSSTPRLTIGGLLFALQRSRTSQLTSQQNSVLLKSDNTLTSVRSRWQSAWGRRSQQEFLSRLRQWKNYINDLMKNLYEHTPYYNSEIRLRVFLSLLTPEMNPPDSVYLEMLDDLDDALKSIFVPGEFIWDQALESAFARETYWYLWGHLNPHNV